MTVYIIENHSSTAEVSGISRYNNILFIIFRVNSIDFRFVSAYYQPKLVNDNEFISLSKTRISNLKFFLKLFRFALTLKGNDFIIHLHHPYLIFPFFLFKGKNNYLLTIQDDQLLNFKRKHSKTVFFFYHHLTNFCLKKYKILISDNQNLSEHFKKKLKNNQKIITLNVPVDTELFKAIDLSDLRKEHNIDESHKIVLFAGRFESQKNPLLALEVFKKLVSENNSLYFWMLGTGSLTEQIKQKVITENILNVKFFGVIPQEEMNIYYNLADVFILTSLHEGGPLTVKEALACNLPVVSTDVGDVKEVISDLPGCFIVKPDVNDFAEKIKEAINAGKSNKLRERAELYSTEIFGKKMIEIYNNIIA